LHIVNILIFSFFVCRRLYFFGFASSVTDGISQRTVYVAGYLAMLQYLLNIVQLLLRR